MLELKELAQFFTDELNNIAKIQDPKVEFLVYAELGEQKPLVTCGILRIEEPIISPIDNILNINYKGLVEFSVKTPESNFNLINIEKIIGLFVEKFNGKNVEFSKGNGVFNFTYSRAKDYKIEAGVGQMTPVSFGFTINYSENVVVEAKKHWFIKEIGENKEFLEIPFLTERVLIEKDGKVNPINDRKYKQAFMMAQQRTYSFTMPYDTTSGIASMLTKDILTGDANKNYILKYYDGIAFTEDEPFLTQVVLYRNGDNGGTKPNTSMLNIVFTDSDDGKNSTKYYMALIDNPFDGTTENTRWFDNQTEQIEWYDKRIKIGADFDSIDAPNLNSLVLTSQIYKNSREYDVFDLVNKNYAIIRVEKTIGDETQKKYYYYKVANANIGANNQVIYDLKLDSVQTWLFRGDIVIEDSFISKAHLDRWIYNDDGTVSFNGKADSKLFEREEIKDVSKRLVNRQKLKYYANGWYVIGESTNRDMPSWGIAKEEKIYYYQDESGNKVSTYGISSEEYANIKDLYVKKQTIVDNLPQVWCYVFLDASIYKVRDPDNAGSTLNVELDNASIGVEGGFNAPTAILCYPVGKDMFIRRNKDDATYDLEIGKFGWDAFEIKNPESTESSFIKGIKLSLKPPIDLANLSMYEFDLRYGTDMMALLPINNDGIANTTTLRSYRLSVLEPFGKYGIFYLREDYKAKVSLRCNDNICRLKFTNSEVLNSDKNKIYNPKLNSMDYKSLTLTIAGSSFEMPIDKINNENPIFSYYESLTPEVTRGLLRLGYIGSESETIVPEDVEDVTNEVFNDAYRSSFNGFSYSNDFTIAFAKTAYAEFIANNKNAYLSFESQQNYNRDIQNISLLQTGTSGLLSTIGGLGGYSGGKPKPFNALGSVTETLQTGADIAFSEASFLKSQSQRQAQFDFSIDNMRNAPGTISSINGSAILTQMVAEFGIYAEVYEGLDNELEIANDIMFRDGYNLNRFAEAGKTVKDYCHTRKFFNYIRATLGNISGVAMSDTMRADLKQRFSNGIRFWHQDKIDYSMENYELKLEEEGE